MEESKTLDNGIAVLRELATSPTGLTVSELASALGVHRPAVYRLLTTLTAHRLVRRDRSKVFHLGAGVLELARAFTRTLGEIAQGVLQQAADAAAMTAMLLLEEGGELITAAVATPDDADIAVRVVVGFRHPPGAHAARLAVDSTRVPTPADPPALVAARERGWAGSLGAAVDGLRGVAAPVDLGPVHGLGCVLLVTFRDDVDVDTVGELAVATAVDLARAT